MPNLFRGQEVIDKPSLKQSFRMNEKYEIALFVLQRITCFFSAMGSLMIISQITRSSFNRSKPQQRLVLGISVSDFVSSTVWVFTPLFMPPESGMIWATGNLTTCNVQGFFDHILRCSWCVILMYASAAISACDQILVEPKTDKKD